MTYTPYQPYGYPPVYSPGGMAPQSIQNTTGWAQSPVGVSVPQPQQGGFLCRPVTSREEALGVQVDYFSPGTLMPDLGHGVVYLKRFNNSTGASDLFQFALVPPSEEGGGEKRPAGQSATLEGISGQLAAVTQRIDALFGAVEGLRPPEVEKEGVSV